MAGEKLTSDERFLHALERGAPEFGVRLEAETVAGLLAYFRLVARWNPRLHLVAPCTPEEFATRHVLESLLALPHLADSSSFVDVGSGAGLPALPCLVARPDLRASLIDSSGKKAVFLREALSAVGATRRAEVSAERFERLPQPRADALTCRALERFTETLPALVAWAEHIPRLLLFGGPSVGAEIDRLGLQYTPVLIPGSERRHLFVVGRAAKK